MNEYVKSHGLGNDYTILDEEKLSFSLNPEIIKLICHRNYGIGSDGILLLTTSNNSDFGLRILNPDGSEAEKSGNGLRIFAKFLFDHNYTQLKINMVEIFEKFIISNFSLWNISPTLPGKRTGVQIHV